MIPVVISDIHSRKDKLLKALYKAEVFTNYYGNPTRNPGFQLIQVGDAVSAGYGMKEAEFYRMWTSLLEPQDIELVGNHEAPILIPHCRIGFYGYNPGDMGTDGCDPELKVEVLARQDAYRVAYSVKGWLITHAGVQKRYQKDDADDTAEHLNGLWDDHLKSGFGCTLRMSTCPICCPHGGVLWVRDLEKTALDPTRIKQIFGHTPDGPKLSKGGTMWNIDTPRVGEGFPNRAVAEEFGGVCVLKWDEDREDWQKFYVE